MAVALAKIVEQPERDSPSELLFLDMVARLPGGLVLFGVVSDSSTLQTALMLPLAVQEMVFAVWLIVKGFAPAEATQAAPISARDASASFSPFPFTLSAMLLAMARPIVAEGIPVRGGVGKMGVPLGLDLGLDMA